MLDKILAFFGFGDGSAKTDARRRHVRYSDVRAEVMVGNRIYSVRNWSMGGLAFDTAPDARLQAGDKVNVILKFRFPHDVITIEEQARIVRAERRGVAAEFAPLPKTTRQQFERVLDSLYAQNFLRSQAAA